MVNAIIRDTVGILPDGFDFSHNPNVKPEIEIYHHLLIEHSLVAEETIFIDDMDANLVAASSLGINTIKFVNASQCRQDLSEFKCI